VRRLPEVKIAAWGRWQSALRCGLCRRQSPRSSCWLKRVCEKRFSEAPGLRGAGLLGLAEGIDADSAPEPGL